MKQHYEYDYYIEGFWDKLVSTSYSITSDLEESKDIVADAFAGLFEKGIVEANKIYCRSIAKLKNVLWLKSVVYTRSLNYKRHIEIKKRRLLEYENLLEYEDNYMETLIEEEDRNEKMKIKSANLNYMIDKLKVRQRTIIRMCFFNFLDRKTISKKLKISPNTVKNQRTNAISNLRKYYGIRAN